MEQPKEKTIGIYKRVPRVVALTGGIGSGKSCARKIFEELGVPCMDADQVAREIHQDPKHPATKAILALFPEVAAPDGRLSRGSLRRRFVDDPSANQHLKAILKPYVMHTMKAWTSQQQSPYVIWESALILDENIEADRILVVDALDDMRVVRIQHRNVDWTREQIDRILAIQLSRTSYLLQADDVIHNNDSIAALQERAAALHAMYLKYWENT